MGTIRSALRDVSQGARPSRLRLLAPLRYLAIDHPERYKYDIIAPLILAAILVLSFYLTEPYIKVFGADGVLKTIRDALAMAVPFMVGSLAAVSMGAPGPHLDRRFVGAELWLDDRALTARQYVCYLLGYLCFLGIVTLGFAILAEVLRDAITTATHTKIWLQQTIKGIGVIFFSLASSCLVVTTFWALYFLTDVVNRPIHQQDP